MAGSLNKAMLIGNVGSDLKIKYTPTGDAVVNFTIATNEIWKGKDGDKNKSTEWHRVVAFRKLAEICNEFLRKGSLVYVEGKIKNKSYQDKDGIKKTFTEIQIETMTMMDRKEVEPEKIVSNESSFIDDDLPF